MSYGKDKPVRFYSEKGLIGIYYPDNRSTAFEVWRKIEEAYRQGDVSLTRYIAFKTFFASRRIIDSPTNEEIDRALSLNPVALDKLLSDLFNESEKI